MPIAARWKPQRALLQRLRITSSVRRWIPVDRAPPAVLEKFALLFLRNGNSTRRLVKRP